MNCIDQFHGNNFSIFNGDCVEVLRGMPEASIDYSIFSPPFSSLYTYSNSPRDMGNVRNDEEFFEHFDFLVRELLRVVKPGHNVSFHCMLLPTSKERDGYIGLKDFRGELIRAFQKHGFIYASEVCIWKDPVTAMQRTKALGLLHKTVRTNATMCRQGIPDYLVTVRRPGEVEYRVTHDKEQFPVEKWQKIASPVWTDIDPSDTLQYRSAREHDDERHICPLQLEVIRRGIDLWTNPGDIVLSPFAGIGSEGFVAVEMGRRFVGVELKGSYYRQAAINLQEAESSKTRDLFAAD
jgi:DNA modification methylase